MKMIAASKYYNKGNRSAYLCIIFVYLLMYPNIAQLAERLTVEVIYRDRAVRGSNPRVRILFCFKEYQIN